MHIPPALVALPLLALEASAFLIPPTIHFNKGLSDVDVTVIPEEKHNGLTKSILVGLPQVVALDCQGCSFLGREGVENKIQLQFEASQARGLVINDVSVLPSAFDAPHPVTISAIQMSLEDGEITAEQPLDFALEKLEPIPSPDDKSAMLIPVRFTVLALGGMPVKTDTVAVHLIKTEDELVLLTTDLIPFGETPGAVECAEEGWSWCRIKAIVMVRVDALMTKMADHKDRVKGGCGGRFGGNSGPKGLGGWRGGRRPHHHHSHYGHHWRARRFGRVLHKTLRFFVIPALLGVIGGLMASAVGMLVGNVLIFVWARFYRRGQRGHASASLIEIVVRDDEKNSLMGDLDEDAPPSYRDVEAVVKGEKQ